MRVGMLGLVVMLSFPALSVPTVARAQRGDRPSIEVARSHMEQGQAYYLQGRFGEAAAEFEAAYEAEPFSAFLYNAAVAYENAGDATRAVDFFQRYLERDPAAADRDGVRQRIERLTAAIAAARAAAPATTPTSEPDTGTGTGTTEPGAAPDTGAAPDSGAATPQPATIGTPAPPPDALPQDFKSLVSVRTTPDGATVIVTEEGGAEIARGYSPFSATLDQGRYHVRIEHPDFNLAEQDVSVEPGKVYVVFVNLSQGEFLGYLRIVTEPPGAQVFVDDRDIGMRGQTPYEASYPVGAHHVWIERPGYAPVERDVEIALGAQVDLRVDLERVAFGRVRVLSNLRGARVSIDGRPVGTVPYEGEVPAGSRVLRVDADGMKAFEQTIEVQRGQLTPVRVRMRPDVGRGGAWVAGTFTLLAVGGGVAMAVFSDDLRQQVERARDLGTLASDDERLDQGFYLAIGADAAFGLAVILGVLTIYYAAYDPLPPSDGTTLEPRDWAFAPMLDPVGGSVGGSVTGRF